MSLPGLELPTLSFAASDGEPTPDTLTVDLDQLITSRLLIQGSSGAGKGWAIRTLLEQTHGRVQQLVLDKEGEFSTLREKYDYILAGAEGDVPATPRTARVLCRHLMELGASAVIDLYDLTNVGRRAFVRNFLSELMALPREFWRPLLVVIDEAHFYAPEGAPSEAADAVISLCSEGRKRGFSPVLATQRLSKLSKDAAADLHNKMIGLTGLDVDVRRAADELGFGKEQAATLKKLKAGQFYVYGPALSPEVTLVRTGGIQTTHPKAGQIASYTPPPPAEAVRALLDQLAGLAEEAEAEVVAEREKVDRTEGLERQVDSLQKQIAETSAQAGATVVEKIVEKVVERVIRVPVLEPGQVEDLRAIADMLAATSKDVMSMAQEIRAGLARVGSASPPIMGKGEVVEAETGLKVAEKATETPQIKPSEPETAPKPPTPRIGGGDAGKGVRISAPQQVILNTLSELAQVGMKTPLREHVALFADVSPASSGYGGNLTVLKRLGLLDYPASGRLALTSAGTAQAVPSERPPTRAALQAAWLRWLAAPQAKLLKHLIVCYPKAMTRAALAQAAGVSASSSGYGSNLTLLKKLGLVDYPRAGQVVATALLFPKGLPAES